MRWRSLSIGAFNGLEERVSRLEERVGSVESLLTSAEKRLSNVGGALRRLAQHSTANSWTIVRHACHTADRSPHCRAQTPVDTSSQHISQPASHLAVRLTGRSVEQVVEVLRVESAHLNQRAALRLPLSLSIGPYAALR